jgi:ABC-type multidrug transport system fused ATPase/permease subunit
VSKQQERLDALENSVAHLQKRLAILRGRSDRYSWLRLAIFLVGVALIVLLFFLAGWLWGLILTVIVVIAFSIAVYYHRAVERSVTRHKLWLQIKKTQIARIQLDWEHLPAVLPKGTSTTNTTNTTHPFETDLDLTGERSLHQLINTAISYEGSQRVRDWLLNTTPDLAVIRQRQTFVQELAPLSRFRNKLTMKSMLAARNAAEHLEGKRLLSWLAQKGAAKPMIATFWISCTLSLILITFIILNIFGVLPVGYWVVAFLLSLGWFLARREERGDLFEDAYFLRDTFAQLSTVFEYLERYPYGKHEHLKKLCEPFFANQTQRPSTLLKKLSRLASAATLEKNQLFWLVVNALIPWDIYVAQQLNRYKKVIATLLPTWLDTWFELEALCSLANFAYLNPEYVIPSVAPSSTGNNATLFQTRGLGHPLIVAEKRVVNDFALHNVGEVIIITGSNMSGKSTFLRTMGINLCLAYAGAPVSARDFHCSLFKLYTCIKVSDSVTDGYSYFYAEVKRLKGLLTALQADGLPLFFLIDEIFKGTNNRERLIGSRAYIRALVGQNCLGAISTHDLELVKIADELPDIHNYHFREEVVDGEMVFDYILRSGPCPTTNALKIMQMEGLPI